MACSWVILAGAPLIGVRALGTVGLPLTSYDMDDGSRKEDSVLYRWSADLVGVNGKGMWRRFYVASTVGKVAPGSALLIRLHCFTGVKDKCRTVW